MLPHALNSLKSLQRYPSVLSLIFLNLDSQLQNPFKYSGLHITAKTTSSYLIMKPANIFQFLQSLFIYLFVSVFRVLILSSAPQKLPSRALENAICPKCIYLIKSIFFLLLLFQLWCVSPNPGLMVKVDAMYASEPCMPMQNVLKGSTRNSSQRNVTWLWNCQQ